MNGTLNIFLSSLLSYETPAHELLTSGVETSWDLAINTRTVIFLITRINCLPEIPREINRQPRQARLIPLLITEIYSARFTLIGFIAGMCVKLALSTQLDAS